MAKHGTNVFLVVISYVVSSFNCGLTLPAAPCCKDSGVVLDCANCDLTVFPTDLLNDRINLTTLDLSHNNISHIPDGSFQNLTSLKILKLIRNRVMNYNKQTFRGLEYLEELEIGFYREEFIAPRLPADVLIPLIGLKVLRLFYRYATEFEPSILSMLTNLHTLQMSSPAEFHLGEEFKGLINLRSLMILDNPGEYFDMTDKTFENVPQLEELQISNVLRNISRTALKGFTRLSTLSLLCNPRLQNADVFKAIKNMRGPTLTMLILDGSQHHGMFCLSSDLIDSPNFSGITHLSLKYTSLVKVDIEVVYYLFNLTYLAIGHNSLVSENVDLSVKEILKLLNGAKIEALDVTGILRPSVDGKFHKYCGSTKNSFRYPPQILNISLDEKRREVSQEDLNVTTELWKYVPPSLQFIFGGSVTAQSLTRNVYQAGVNNILYIDLSYDKATRLPFMVGLKKLQGVDASYMGLRSINVQQLVELPSLRYANLSHNNLQAMDLNMLLRGGLKLEWLDLGYNDIENISLSLQNMTALRYLSLRGNTLSDFALSFGNNTQLHELDLSNCLMKSLPSEVRKELDGVQSRLRHQLNVDLSGNRFECSCDMLDMIKWFQNTQVNIVDRSKLQCSDKNTSVIVVEIDLHLMSKNCQHHGTLILSLTLSFVIGCTFLVSALIAYRYKWHLRFYIYKGRQLIKRLVTANEEILLDDLDTYMYDAFVVYEESQDYEWVENELIPKISDEWGFEFCITGMFDGGRSVFQVCETAIRSSRMIILVVTPAYAADEWCQFQMEMILTTKRDRIIVICKEDIPPNNLSRTLLALMESGCLEYSQELVALEMFWRRLHDKLRQQYSVL